MRNSKHSGIFNLTYITICLCSLFLASSKKSTEPVWLPPWEAIIRDYRYLERTFYDLGYSTDFAVGDSITEIKLFKSNYIINSNTGEDRAPLGLAYVDPSDTLALYPEGIFLRRFREIAPNDYLVDRSQHWFRFFRVLEKNDILAVFYVVRHSNSTFDTVGNISDSCTASENEICMRLKLIKPDTPKPKDYTWEYEWKNVYDLGTTDIPEERFRLLIYKGPLNAENIWEDPISQDGTLYLQIFGLDQLDLDGNANPDGIIDYRQMDFDLGYLIFPNRHPFAPYPNISFTGNPKDTLQEQVYMIYRSNNLMDRLEQSTYYLYVVVTSWEYSSGSYGNQQVYKK